MPARRFVMLVKESSYGVPMTSPVVGVDSIYLRLGDGTDIQDDPMIQTIPYGGGRTTAACAWSDQRRHEGTINTKLYPTQAKLLLDWWLTNINDARTTPWVTTDPNGMSPPTDLASMSIYDAIQERDGTFTRLAHRGAKVKSGTLSASADGDARAWNLQLQVQAGAVETVTDTEFPAPAETDYPCGPFVFSHIAGKLKIGSSRSLFDNISFSADNGLVAKYFESQTPSMLNTYGRNTTLGLALVRKKTPDDYASFKSVLPQDAELELNNGARFVKIDLHGNNHWDAMAKQLPDGDVYGWQAALRNKWDAAQATDLTVTGGVVTP